jgi:hypothetical protein
MYIFLHTYIGYFNFYCRAHHSLFIEAIHPSSEENRVDIVMWTGGLTLSCGLEVFGHNPAQGKALVRYCRQ